MLIRSKLNYLSAVSGSGSNDGPLTRRQADQARVTKKRPEKFLFEQLGSLLNSKTLGGQKFVLFCSVKA